MSVMVGVYHGVSLPLQDRLSRGLTLPAVRTTAGGPAHDFSPKLCNFLRILGHASARSKVMNILFVQPALPHYRVPFFTELQRRAGGELRVWSDHNHPLVPFSNPNGAFEAVHCAETAVGGLLSQPALLRAVRDPRATVVVLPWNSRYVQLVPALIEAQLRRKPVVLWGHGYSKRFSYWKHRARNTIGKLATACVTYSEPTRQRLITEGLDAEKVFSAPNTLDGVPIEREREYWRAHGDELALLQQRLGIRAGKVILFVSRLERDKRVDLLLEAASRVASHTPDVQLLIVGTGPELARLEELAQQRGIAGHVRFLGAIYDEHELGGIFASATVLAYPVAVGLSILHALNYGVPVVTSDDEASHNPEFDALIPGCNSLLYRHEDVGDFAAQVERILKNGELHTHLCDGALKSVSGPNGRTIEVMAAAMLEAIRFASERGTNARS